MADDFLRLLTGVAAPCDLADVPSDVAREEFQIEHERKIFRSFCEFPELTAFVFCRLFVLGQTVQKFSNPVFVKEDTFVWLPSHHFKVSIVPILLADTARYTLE